MFTYQLLLAYLAPQGSLDSTVTWYRKVTIWVKGAGWHANLKRRIEVEEMEANRELVVEFLSTIGDSCWLVRESRLDVSPEHFAM